MANRKDVALSCRGGFGIAADKDLGMCLANDFGDCLEDTTRQITIEAIWRSLESGLIIFNGAMPEEDENGRERPFTLLDLIRLREDPWDGYGQCMSAEFILSPEGEALMQAYPVECGPATLPPGFFERLSEIFTAHGVGWDVPCPYRVVPWGMNEDD